MRWPVKRCEHKSGQILILVRKHELLTDALRMWKIPNDARYNFSVGCASWKCVRYVGERWSCLKFTLCACCTKNQHETALSLAWCKVHCDAIILLSTVPFTLSITSQILYHKRVLMRICYCTGKRNCNCWLDGKSLLMHPNSLHKRWSDSFSLEPWHCRQHRTSRVLT